MGKGNYKIELLYIYRSRLQKVPAAKMAFVSNCELPFLYQFQVCRHCLRARAATCFQRMLKTST